MNRFVQVFVPVGLACFATVSATLPGYAQLTSQSGNISECAVKAIEGDNPAKRITDLGRAKHLARQTAEAANGGLGVYRADISMHSAVSDAPCVDNGDGTWTFTVKGGKPGFTTPTQETVVMVDGNTWKTKVVSNNKL